MPQLRRVSKQKKNKSKNDNHNTSKDESQNTMDSNAQNLTSAEVSEDPASSPSDNNRDSSNSARNYVKVETEVIYPNLPNGSQPMAEGRQESRNNKSGDINKANSNDQIDTEKQPLLSTSSSSSSSSCPPLFIPSSKFQNNPNQNIDNLPPFYYRVQCNTSESISTHPYLYLTAIITILFFIYCSCCRKRKKNNYNNPFFFTRKKTGDSNARGEYSALETVYDELLDDFENEDLSSYLHDDDDDDDSVGTIISQWSEGGMNGKIELTGFDDGHLSLKEMNG